MPDFLANKQRSRREREDAEMIILMVGNERTKQWLLDYIRDHRKPQPEPKQETREAGQDDL